MFKREIGMVVDDSGYIWMTILGDLASVNFPTIELMNILKSYPNKKFIFAHSHPPGIENWSSDDHNLFMSWAMTFTNRIVFDIIVCKNTIIHKRYSMKFCDKNNWVEKGKHIDGRDCLITITYPKENDTFWVKKIVELSYF